METKELSIWLLVSVARSSGRDLQGKGQVEG